MNTVYTFALAFFDEATHLIGVTPVDVLANSFQEAAIKLDTLKHNPEWMKTLPALGIQDLDDLEGIVVGDYLLMKETIAPPDSPETDAVL